MIRKPKDRDFIQTQEDLFFCIVDYIHPENYYTAYLKYIPSDKGKWQFGDTHYWRVLNFYHVFNVEKTFEFLKERFPHYIRHDKFRHIEMSMVPKEKIKQYFIPENRFATIVNSPKNRLEKDAIEIADKIANDAGLELKNFGITGSILIGLANEKFSDVDLTVYGLKESHKVKHALIEIKNKKDTIYKMPRERQEKWIMDKQKQFGIPYSLSKYLLDMKWNYGILQNRRYFSIHPIRKDNEINEKYGEKEYIDLGYIKIKATIVDDSEAVFLPAIYKIENVEIIEGPKVDNLVKIVSYEGLFGDITTKDMKIIAAGKLEKVICKNKTYYRVVLGAGGLKKPQYMGPMELINA